MSREVEFRGKDKYGNWIYGDLLRYSSGETAILNRFSRYGYEATEICNRRKVLPETIGQFTGLKDKNGKEIYDGDICESIDGIFLVTWDEEKSAFVMVFQDGERLYLEEMWEDTKIIGNINDTPELIKVNNED